MHYIEKCFKITWEEGNRWGFRRNRLAEIILEAGWWIKVHYCSLYFCIYLELAFLLLNSFSLVILIIMGGFINFSEVKKSSSRMCHHIPMCKLFIPQSWGDSLKTLTISFKPSVNEIIKYFFSEKMCSATKYLFNQTHYLFQLPSINSTMYCG